MQNSFDTTARIEDIYQKPVAGQPVTVPVVTKASSPVMKVRWCNILKPFYYQTSPNIPRYSITCVLDPNDPQHEEFIKKLRMLEHKEGTDTVLKDEICKNQDGEAVKTGNHLIKFQTKEKVPLLIKGPDGKETPATIESELPYGTEVGVTFDVIRYQQRMANQPPKKGLNFKPKFITILNMASAQTTFEKQDEEVPF